MKAVVVCVSVSHGNTARVATVIADELGAAVVELRARRISVMESGIGGLIVINLILSFTLANISVGAHIGGLIGGALAGLVIRTADERGMPAVGIIACALMCVASVAGALAAASATGAGIA